MVNLIKDQQNKVTKYRCDVCDWEFFESDKKIAFEKFMKHSELESHLDNILVEMLR